MRIKEKRKKQKKKKKEKKKKKKKNTEKKKKKHSVHLKWAKNFRAPNHYSSHSFATAKWWAFSDCCPGIFSKTPREALLRKTQVSGVEKYSTVLFAKELIVFVSSIFPKKKQHISYLRIVAAYLKP